MHISKLLESFSEDIGIAEQLLDLIDNEFQALSDRDLTALQDILGLKQPLLALLDQHAKARTQLLTNLNLSANREGLAALAATSQLGSELLEKGDQLNELFERCRLGNERNGRLIRTSQNSAGQILNLLRGTDAPNLYDKRGVTSKASQHRPLDQA
ncbi:flagellar protein FlgN [Ectopseudomonas mendocina]|uniref:Flagellar protein FlgN n=1 Tax=Ectopseudomonas mendocina TaxID=300 RepID=A0ABZ2RK64_ECTME